MYNYIFYLLLGICTSLLAMDVEQDPWQNITSFPPVSTAYFSGNTFFVPALSIDSPQELLGGNTDEESTFTERTQENPHTIIQDKDIRPQPDPTQYVAACDTCNTKYSYHKIERPLHNICRHYKSKHEINLTRQEARKKITLPLQIDGWHSHCPSKQCSFQVTRSIKRKALSDIKKHIKHHPNEPLSIHGRLLKKVILYNYADNPASSAS
jgi:hypothetical protein